MVLDRQKSFQYKSKIEDTFIFYWELEAHIENHCKKASYKLYALENIRKFLTVRQAKALASSFVCSQFGYMV